MGIVNKPFTFVAFTTKAGEASQVNADLDALFSEFNGSISDANILALANINQSKILNLTADLNTIRAERVQEIAIQFFATPGFQTYFKPTNLLFVQIICIAGGGGGGSPNFAGSGFRAGGGGGGGAMAVGYFLAVNIAGTEGITIGAGGLGGGLGLPGATGGTSNFGTLVIADGGGGGAAGTDNLVARGASGGAATAGQLLIGGSDGGHGLAHAAGAWIGGQGGSSPMGGGGVGAMSGVVAAIGRNFGGGGGGGIADTGTNAAGVNGANGLVFVVEYRA